MQKNILGDFNMSLLTVKFNNQMPLALDLPEHFQGGGMLFIPEGISEVKVPNGNMWARFSEVIFEPVMAKVSHVDPSGNPYQSVECVRYNLKTKKRKGYKSPFSKEDFVLEIAHHGENPTKKENLGPKDGYITIPRGMEIEVRIDPTSPIAKIKKIEYRPDELVRRPSTLSPGLILTKRIPTRNVEYRTREELKRLAIVRRKIKAEGIDYI
jgi:hypothetical protein